LAFSSPSASSRCLVPGETQTFQVARSQHRGGAAAQAPATSHPLQCPAPKTPRPPVDEDNASLCMDPPWRWERCGRRWREMCLRRWARCPKRGEPAPRRSAAHAAECGAGALLSTASLTGVLRVGSVSWPLRRRPTPSRAQRPWIFPEVAESRSCVKRLDCKATPSCTKARKGVSLGYVGRN